MTSRMHIDKSEELVIQDRYFVEGMGNNSANGKVRKREERQNFVQKLCVHTVNGQMNKH